MNSKIFVITLILAGVIVVGTSCRAKVKESNSAESADKGFMLSEAQIQLANISMAEAREGTLGRKLSLTGVLKVNEESAFSISSRTPGRIEKLYFRNTGETVKKGDKLYEFYSEDLISAQREYLTLQKNNWNFNAKYEPSLAIENKLLIMGMVQEQIDELAKNGKISFSVNIYSTVEGKIRSINVTEGEYITPGQLLFELASDDKLWVEAQVYPDDIQYIKPGMTSTAVFPLSGEPPVKCIISFINPSFEKGENVTLARAVINNPGNRLHPGMLAVLTLQAQKSRGILIPSSAVISDSGGDVVWIRSENGAFSQRKVTTGLQSGDSVIVITGIDASDNIVISGAYLLNSELTLKQGTDTGSAPTGIEGTGSGIEIKEAVNQ